MTISDSSLDGGDISSQVIYNDKNVFVTLTDEDLINSTINTNSIESYYKKSYQGNEKICELRVPRSSSSLTASKEDTKNLDDELEDIFQLNLNQNKNYSFINCTYKISHEEPTNIHNGGLKPGSGFDRLATDAKDGFDQFHHQYVINWAEEPVYDAPEDVPDWALIPGVDCDRHDKADITRRNCSTTANIDGFDQFHHQYVINWAGEPAHDGPVDVPDWALIPGFDCNIDAKDDCSRRNCSTTENTDGFIKFHHVINWAEEPTYDGPVDVPDWALIPGIDHDRYIYDVAKEHAKESGQIYQTYM